MHILAVLLFFGALILALGVIQDMFVTRGMQILAALSGERILLDANVNVVNFSARSAPRRANHHNRETKVTLPLAA